jgi:hypothetical protein
MTMLLFMAFFPHGSSAVYRSADQDAASAVVLHEWYLLRVKEAQGFLGTEMAHKTVQERSLILMVLNPTRRETEQGSNFCFTLGQELECVLLAATCHLIDEHPCEWDGRRRVGRVA